MERPRKSKRILAPQKENPLKVVTVEMKAPDGMGVIFIYNCSDEVLKERIKEEESRGYTLVSQMAYNSEVE